tara:strand:- start:7689 stop:7955 length:267 start_codon:yes stop_codon:yes gene_type:complete
MKDLKAHNVIDVSIQLHDCKQIPKAHHGAHIIGYTATKQILIGILYISPGGTPCVKISDTLEFPIYTYTLIEHTKKDFEHAINKYNRT